jgi:5-methylcytosine-specific restriction endonuclease McrA
MEEGAATEWQVVHERLVNLARTRAGLDFDEGVQLLAAHRERVHERLGYGGFVEYIERLFGYSPRLTYEKLRVAEALERLPELAERLRDGKLSWSGVRELTRVATPETEHDWIAAAAGTTARETERLVSGHRLGDRPEDPVDDALRRHVLRFEVTGEVLATFREALAKIRREAAGPLDDDAALLLLARHVLAGGAQADGGASYQVAINVCERCQEAYQQAGPDRVHVGGEVAQMAKCDGEVVPSAHVGTTVKRARQSIPPAVRRLVLRRDGHCCAFPGCRHCSFVDVHHIDSKADGGNHDPDNLVTLCSAHHRAVHRGEVTIEGRVAQGLRFKHADGTPYGGRVRPLEVEVRARAFRALRSMGFRESEIRRAFAGLQTHDEAPPGFEATVRAALVRLTEDAAEKAS